MPLKFFVDKFSHVRFEPSGWTGNPQVPYAKSIMDYIFRWLGGEVPGAGVCGRRSWRNAALQPTEPIRSRRCRLSRGGGCAVVRGMRVDHDAQWVLLQVRELRRDQRL